MACVDLFASLATAVSIPRSIGQIYGLLYASPVPLSFSEIVERLDISKGSVSQGLGLLKVLGAINDLVPSRQTRDPRHAATLMAGTGGRTSRVVYGPELSLRRLVSGILRERIAPVAASGADRLGRLRQLAKQDGGNREFYLGRAKQLEGWRRRLKTVLPVLVALLGPSK